MTKKTLLNKALEFARKVHAHQVYNDRPYIVHPILTAQIVEFVAPTDINLIAAGYLHDTIEDQNVTPDTLRVLFNDDVADLVLEVTKDENNDFPNITTIRGLLLKTADRFANVSSLDRADQETAEKLFDKYSFCYTHEGTHLKTGGGAM